MCVLRGKPIKIPTKIAASYVRYAKEISDVSYSKAETFSSTLLGASSGQMFTTGKPKLPVRVKVIQSLICTSGKVVNVRIIVKNIRDRATEIIKGMSRHILRYIHKIPMINMWPCASFSLSDELMKLHREWYGRYVSKAQMADDKVLLPKHCFTAFVKCDPRTPDDSFFSTVHDKDCTPDLYLTNYDKPIDDNMKKVAMKYALDKDILLITPLDTDSPSKNYISNIP